MQLGMEILKRRTLHLPRPLSTAEAGKAVCVLSEMIGVRGVTLDGAALHLTYDLVQVKPEEIKAGIAAAGWELGDDLMETLHLAFEVSDDHKVCKSGAGTCGSCC